MPVRTNAIKELEVSASGMPYEFFGLIRMAEATAVPNILFSVANQVLVPRENAKGGDRSV